MVFSFSYVASYFTWEDGHGVSFGDYEDETIVFTDTSDDDDFCPSSKQLQNVASCVQLVALNSKSDCTTNIVDINFDDDTEGVVFLTDSESSESIFTTSSSSPEFFITGGLGLSNNLQETDDEGMELTERSAETRSESSSDEESIEHSIASDCSTIEEHEVVGNV